MDGPERDLLTYRRVFVTGHHSPPALSIFIDFQNGGGGGGKRMAVRPVEKTDERTIGRTDGRTDRRSDGRTDGRANESKNQRFSVPPFPLFSQGISCEF